MCSGISGARMASYLSPEVKFNLTAKGLCWDFQELYERYVRARGVLGGKEGGRLAWEAKGGRE